MSSSIIIVTALLIVIAASSSEKFTVPVFDEEIGESVFQQGIKYLLYICDHQNPHYLSLFTQYCEQFGKLCAVVDNSVEMYQLITVFIGMKTSQYLAILDSSTYNKYTLPLESTTTVQDISKFHQSFQAGTLDRHYTSEDIPTENIDPLMDTVVGHTYEQFIFGSATVKVLFLYTDNQACGSCKQVYDMVAQAAQQFGDRSKVSFGHMDLFKNDHRLLRQVDVPVVLIYSFPPEYVKLQKTENIQKLSQRLREILNDAVQL